MLDAKGVATGSVLTSWPRLGVVLENALPLVLYRPHRASSLTKRETPPPAEIDD
jgi:hypothetical protein